MEMGEQLYLEPLKGAPGRYFLHYCCYDFNSVSARLPCCLSKGHLKQEFLGIILSTFFALRNFGNT